MSANIDEIWAAMNPRNATSNIVITPIAKKIHQHKNKVEERMDISLQEFKGKIARDLNALSDENKSLRRSSLLRLQKSFFVKYSLTDDDNDELFHDICKIVLKRFSDECEQCRSSSQKIVAWFFARCSDLAPVIGYFFPALFQRIPMGLGYDDELKIFVSNIETHNEFKRGRAIDRQDKEGVLGSVSFKVIEESEEIRLLACQTLSNLLNRVDKLKSHSILHPYFQDIVMFVQYHLRDPFPAVKVLACEMLVGLAKVQDYEPGMKLFAVALVRSILSVLRHRHSKVRSAAVSALQACMTVPDRAKRKAAGSEAIPDLIGFREDNVVQVAAFYKPDILVNYLAELVVDKSVAVREKLAGFLTVMMTEIDDRWDHHTRMLPYLLDLLTDEVPEVASIALDCLCVCGQQFEEEHFKDIVDKRQYGVDGDDRINLSKPLPKPFLDRPRIGIRLFVRGNSKRFLSALVGELTNWISQTRLKSAHLLKMIVVLCEEHLTMEAHTLLPAYIKALKFAHDDKDGELQKCLLEVFELAGRYMLPEVYVYYILPRLRGDADVVAFGTDSDTRIVVMQFLRALLEGSKPSALVPFFEEIVGTITDPYVISPDSSKLQLVAIEVLHALLLSLQGKGHNVVETHFLATGRLTSLKKSKMKVFKLLLVALGHRELKAAAHSAVSALAGLEEDSGHDERSLMAQYGPALLTELLEKYEVDGSWSSTCADHMLLCRLIDGLVGGFIQDPRVVEATVRFLCSVAASSSCLDFELENTVLLEFSRLITSVLARGGPRATGDIDKIALHAVELYALDVRWSRVPVLMTQRLRFVEQVFLIESAVAGESWSAALCSCFPRLLEAVVGSAAQPTNPVEVRILMLEVLTAMFEKLRRHLGVVKLKPYTYWARTLDAKTTATLLRCQEAVSAVATDLLGMLHDVCDHVRRRAIVTLLAAIPFFHQELSFRDAVTRLLCALNELVAGSTAEDEFAEQVMGVLYAVCVLDPDLFQVLAREALNKVDSRAAIRLGEHYSRLVGHADLLATLPQRIES